MDKKHLALKMMSNEEIKKHISPFLSKNWQKRVEDKKQKVKNRLLKIQNKKPLKD